MSFQSPRCFQSGSSSMGVSTPRATTPTDCRLPFRGVQLRERAPWRPTSLECGTRRLAFASLPALVRGAPALTSPASFDALVPYGWDERVAALYASLSEPHNQPGRVGRVDRDRCTVRTALGTTVRASASVLPITGDWVVLDFDPN